MKVLGEDGDSGFIVWATRRELAQVMGYFWESETPCPPIKVGCVIPVAECYEAISRIRELKSSVKEIEKRSERLLSIIKTRQGHLDPVIEQAEKKVGGAK